MEFNNLQEALTYHSACYMCGSTLTPSFHGDPIFLSMRSSRMDGGRTIEINLSSQVDSSCDDILTLDTHHNRIKFVSKQRYSNYVDSTYFPIRKTYQVNYGNQLYESFIVNCQKCQSFSYVIQIVLSLPQERLQQILLNSEHIQIQDEKKQYHNIINGYISPATEYTIYQSKNILERPFSSIHTLSLPLIPINFHHPQETLHRIQKLLLFS
jgi:hypothetical protein